MDGRAERTGCAVFLGFVVGCGWMRVKILYIPTWGSSYGSSFELQLVGKVGGGMSGWGRVLEWGGRT